MTGERTGENISEQVDAHAIPKGSVAGFLISQRRTLIDLVRPAIMQAYPGLTAENFLLSKDGTTLYLTDGAAVDLAPVQHHGATFYPKLTNLAVTSNGQILTLTSHTETAVETGFTAICQATHWYTVGLGSSNNGQTLVFQEYQSPSIIHSVVQSKGSQLTEEIIAIVAAIALLILAILTDGVALIVGGLVIGLLIGADQMTPALIDKVNKDDSPAIDLLVVNAVNPIRWPNSQIFKLDYGSLNVSLQLGGDPLFV